MTQVLLFASMREAAGLKTVDATGVTVGDVLDELSVRFGSEFDALLAHCSVWIGDEPSTRDQVIAPNDEMAVLPPFSGG